MGSRSAPAPAAPPAPAPVATPVTPETSKDPANRAVARRADDGSAADKASLLNSQGAGDLDPLTQRKTLAGGSAELMG